MDHDGRSTPPPATRHASATYKGRLVDVTVHADPACPTRHIVVVVHDDAPGGFDRRAEFVTDTIGVDAALGTGIEVARALVDGRLH